MFVLPLSLNITDTSHILLYACYISQCLQSLPPKMLKTPINVPPSLLSLFIFLSLSLSLSKQDITNKRLGARRQIPTCSSLWHWWHAMGLTGAGDAELQHLHTWPHPLTQGMAQISPLRMHSVMWKGWKALKPRTVMVVLNKLQMWKRHQPDLGALLAIRADHTESFMVQTLKSLTYKEHFLPDKWF